jgi:hypothetical protein
MALNRKLLAIYLNDHLAGATVGTSLSKRIAGQNRDNEFGPVFERLHEEIDEDRDVLRAVMRKVGAKEDPVKRVVAFVAERAGRLKLNGSLVSYSPLSRVVEIEGLALGVTGKLALWRSLGEVQAEELTEFDFAALAVRAEAQQETIEGQRLAAVRVALTK